MYRPWNGRRVGIEIEAIIPQDRQTAGNALDTALAVVTHAVANPSDVSTDTHWRDSAGHQWDVKRDGSLPSGLGVEVASQKITLDAAGHNGTLKAVCDGLRGAGARLTSNCGLHVSVDVSDFDWSEMQKLMALWARYEPFFYSLAPAARRDVGRHDGGYFCRPVRAGSWDHAQRVKEGRNATQYWTPWQEAVKASGRRGFDNAAARVPKYVGMRIEKWVTQGRVEFRFHSGSLSYDKIRKLAMLLLALVERVKHPVPSTRKLDQSRPELGFTAKYVGRQIGLIGSDRAGLVNEGEAAPEGAEVVEWCERRRAKFAEQHKEFDRRHGFDAPASYRW